MGSELVEQAKHVCRAWSGNESTVVDGTEVDEIETAVACSTAEEDGVLEVLGKDFTRHVHVAVWSDTVRPVIWNLLVASEGVGSVGLFLSSKER